MIAIRNFLKELIATPGLSGYEATICREIERNWQPLVDEIHITRLGSLHGLKKGSLLEDRPSLLLAAHMDSIGLMVRSIQGEFLRVTAIGDIDPSLLPGQMVTIHGRKEIPGIIALPPSHLLSPPNRKYPIKIENLLVDTGQDAHELPHLVGPGDLISFATPPLEMGAGCLSGPSLDNRASIAAVTHCLTILKNEQLAWDVWAAATVQEETTLGGGLTSAFQLQPSIAIAIDVTYGAGPGSPAHKTFPIGKGPTLGWGPTVHPYLYQTFKALSNKLEIPGTIEVMPRLSGTDADGMQLAVAGIPTMVISIPIRYMHSPVEMVLVEDILQTGRLLAEFILGLDDNYLDNVTWDDQPKSNFTQPGTQDSPLVDHGHNGES